MPKKYMRTTGRSREMFFGARHCKRCSAWLPSREWLTNTKAEGNGANRSILPGSYQDFFTDIKVKSAKDDITLHALGEKLLKIWLDAKIQV